MSRRVLFSILIAANLMWGSVWVVAKVALSELTPVQISAWRMIAAGLISIPLLVRPLRAGTFPRRIWPQVLLLSAMGFVIGKFLSFWGVDLSTATDTSLLMSMEPLFTVALGWLVLGERMGGRRLKAVLAGVAGAYLLIAQGWRPPSLSTAHVAGNLIFILALVLEAGYSVFGKTLLTRYPALLLTTATIVASLVFWVPIAMADIAAHGWPVFTGVGLAAIAFLSLGCTVAAYLAWFFALERLDAGLVAMTLFVQPVWGALLAVTLLGESLTAYTLAGGALVLLSLYLTLWPPTSTRPSTRAVPRKPAG